MFVGAGTVANVVAVLVGSGIGLLVGNRLPARTRVVVTDGLGLVTLLIAGLSAVAVTDRVLSDAVGPSAPVLIVLGAVVIGGLIGSLLRLEHRLESSGTWLQGRLGGSDDEGARARFVEGFVTASLVFCVGPLTILGALTDGLGGGAEQLLLKSALDGFAAIAFAASLGVGVMAAAITVGVVQGGLTVLGALLGSFVPEPHVVALTATGGVLLVGVGLRLLNLRSVAVGDMLPALVVAPLLVQSVVWLR
ncbi:DUF554 domain-containing protein [Mumia sp. zg.B21]|uniref:DUF554 domain-containing protein n=1 Tax=unclassified Mumia TaxID=2621872 RepID=UPI001C6ED806|nr:MULTISPECIES: DUF554 domain-containing protein [unclassified Mumia]MBW9211519.1 DUF554 domain-containing protein [Mumia sp. zg.B21]MDD9349374.1 DUF554 domain-containing protein [Mumia sp.]